MTGRIQVPVQGHNHHLNTMMSLRSILGGGFYFQDFENMALLYSTPDTGSWVCFWMGILVMFTGIYLLSPPEYKEDGGENDHLINSDGELNLTGEGTKYIGFFWPNI